MSVELEYEIGQGGVPVGVYRATFDGLEPFDEGEFGPAVKWLATVTAGEQKGQSTSRITSLKGGKPGPKTAFAKMMAGIIGAPLSPGQKVDLKPFIGKEYLIQVEQSPKGNGTRIAAFMPLPDVL